MPVRRPRLTADPKMHPKYIDDFTAVNSFYHKIGAGDPRTPLMDPRSRMLAAIKKQSRDGKKSNQYKYFPTAEGQRMLKKRYPGLEMPMAPMEPGGAFATGDKAYVAHSVNEYPPGMQNFAAGMGYNAVANHEMEHAHDQPIEKSQRVHDSKIREVGPAVGDLVFRSEQFAREEGKPLKHKVLLPGAVQHDINWMREQARQHGYFDGRSMSDLIFNTPAGKSWYKKQLLGRKYGFGHNPKR